MVPSLALAASVRDWPDRLHRFLLDHGGARVSSRVMGVDQAVSDEFDVLLIDDVCSFLSSRLVSRLRDQGREVIGVFDPSDGPDAKRRLLESGITDVIESDAEPDEFVSKVAATLAHRPAMLAPVVRGVAGFRIGVLGASPGAGATESAVTLAAVLSERVSTVLVDLDQTWSSVAQRLDLAPHPNLRTAVDLAHHAPDRLEEALISTGRLQVVVGGGIASQPIPVHELEGLIDDMASSHAVLVADLGDIGSAGRPFASRFDLCLLVGHAGPVGLSRLMRAVDGLSGGGGSDLLVVVNRVPGDAHRRDDVRMEVGKAISGVPIVFLPDDPRIERCAWDGVVQTRGPFRKAISKVAGLIEGSLPG